MTRDPREALIAWRQSTGYSNREAGAVFGVSRDAMRQWCVGLVRVPQRVRARLRAEGYLARRWEPWAPEHDVWLATHRDQYPMPELAVQISAAFGIPRTESGLRQHLQNCGQDTYTSAALLTSERVAALCAVSRPTVRRWVEDGWLAVPSWSRRGGCAPWAVPPTVLRVFVEEYAVHLQPDRMPPSPYREIVAAAWERHRWLDAAAASRYAGVNRRQIAEWCHAGRLPAVYQRRRHHVAWVMRARDLAAFLRDRRVA